MPRADISKYLTSDLLSKLENSNWKVRKEGLDAIEAILE